MRLAKAVVVVIAVSERSRIPLLLASRVSALLVVVAVLSATRPAEPSSDNSEFAGIAVSWPLPNSKSALPCRY